MGCICSTRAERKKKRRRGHIIQVQPIGDGSQRVMSKTDFSVYQVKKPEPEPEETVMVMEEYKVKNYEMLKTEEETPKLLEQKYENDQGMVIKLTGVAARGVAFEIAEIRTAVAAPPPRLLEMERKSKRREASEDEIKEKLMQAERRRKQLEEERVLKVRKMVKTETPEAVQAYIAQRQALEDVQTKRMENAVASRQQRLRKIRDKIREKDRHAKSVRQRRILSLDGLGEAPREEKYNNFHTN